MELGGRRIDIRPRGSISPRISSTVSPVTGERMVIAEGGLNFVIENLNMVVEGIGQVDLIDVDTDRLVAWTGSSDLFGIQGEALPGGNSLEIYLEGNVVFRQGSRIIFADRMYFDVRNERGLVVNSEMLTPVPEFQGKIRLKADVLQQLDANRFMASNAMLTSSRLGIPQYWFHSDSVSLIDIKQPPVDPITGLPVTDPVTGAPPSQRLATSQNNFLYLGGVPVFYWPVIATNLEDPTFYLKRIRGKHDSIFGLQILTDWDAYQLFGVRNPIPGTEWDLTLDILSERGVGLGTSFEYGVGSFLTIPGPASGLIDVWGIHDSGNDNLGGSRDNVPPEADFRGRIFGRHRQHMPYGLQFTGELGLISDRHFLEQYFENEWDEFKDQTTGAELKQYVDNSTWSVTSDIRANGFFTQTEWLPRVDHFWLGESFANDWFTWYEHSHVGYGRLRVLEPPSDPAEAALFTLAPWEADVRGERATTRQELDLPLQLGIVKVVPFALGELSHWGQDITGQDLQRAYWQSGVRASIPMWTANPAVESGLWNIHGLAHKVFFDVEATYAEANRDFTQLPLYDPLDDDSVEQFRRRYPFFDFGGASIPLRFDERFYALRSGIGDSVTSPSTEIADDLAAVRFGVRQRLQTKRGPIGARRIIDWMVFDTRAVYFPDGDRDNFGENVGLFTYDFRWHVGDRTTLLSDGAMDFFTDGQRVYTVGAFLNRPPRGSFYLGFRSIMGPFESQVVGTSFTYLMSPKWYATAGSSVDLQDTGNIGQRFTVTRISESYLASVGLTVDSNKDNVGVIVAIEPRFLPFSSLGRSLGASIPTAGEFGIE